MWVAVPEGQGHSQVFLFRFLVPTVLPSLLLTSSAQGLGPVTASSFALSEGSLGEQWGPPSAGGSWPVTGVASAIHSGQGLLGQAE